MPRYLRAQNELDKKTVYLRTPTDHNDSISDVFGINRPHNGLFDQICLATEHYFPGF